MVEQEGELGEQPNTHTPSPHRAPSVAMEVSNEDIPNIPSPCQTRGVTLEEVEDEDMQQVPRWGPHPFANPTPTHLYSEPHPDPTAGTALWFYPADRTAPPLYESVLVEPDTFKEAYWLDHLPIPQLKEAEYFTLPR
ncbi:hypothetical protein FRC10_011699, partial [Ceratobasidium sp. 414]